MERVNESSLHSDFSMIDSFAKKKMLQLMSKLKGGTLTIIDSQGVEKMGVAGDSDSSLNASIDVQSPHFYRDLLLGGSLGVAEAYMDGYWTSPDLVTLFRLMVKNLPLLLQLETSWTTLKRYLSKAYHYLRRNSRQGSKQNIADHYDLGNDFYELMLDKTMAYSSGVFTEADENLGNASLRKFDKLCQLLQLKPQDRLIEIGTGWGGFAIHAAKNYGCQVTTTTISKEQYAYAKKRIEEEGLSGKITLLDSDYRDLKGKYDKLVSIEMIEAVGHEYFDTYFQKCSELLKEDGLAALQMITIPDQHYDRHIQTVDFIKRYIFPGSTIPSISAVMDSVKRVTDFRLAGFADITPHYATTLRLWRENFFENIESVRQMGFSERFIRMWEYYLCYCEASFSEHYNGDVHMLFAKPVAKHPV